MKMWKRLLMAVCLCAIWSFTALAAEDDPVKIERVKLKFESFRPKDGYVKITNLGTGYSVGDCEIINDSDIDNWNSSYCARLQIELTADDGYEFRKKGKSYFDLKGSDFYRYESSDYDDKEVIWLCVDMAPLNRSIGVPLDPVWTADGTAKWTVAYKADAYNITLMENGKKKKTEDDSNDENKNATQENKTNFEELKKQAIEAERKRLQEIDEISKNIPSELVQEAKYGQSACSASDLALRAIQFEEKTAQQSLTSMVDDTKNSKVNLVSSEPPKTDKNTQNMSPNEKLQDARAEVRRIMNLVNKKDNGGK